MPRLNGAQIGLILGMLLLGVLIYVAPHMSSNEKQEPIDRSVDIKINEALKMVNEGEAPMKGILMLREIAEEHPENIRAQFQLGMLSIRSGQYEKAVQRFDNVIGLDSLSFEAFFYRAHAKAGMQNFAGAKSDFEKIINSSADDELKTEARKYLTELKSNENAKR